MFDEEHILTEFAKEYGPIIRKALRELEDSLPPSRRPPAKGVPRASRYGLKYEIGTQGSETKKLSIEDRNHESEGYVPFEGVYAWRSNVAQIKLGFVNAKTVVFLHMNEGYADLILDLSSTIIAKVRAYFIEEAFWRQYRNELLEERSNAS